MLNVHAWRLLRQSMARYFSSLCPGLCPGQSKGFRTVIMVKPGNANAQSQPIHTQPQTYGRIPRSSNHLSQHSDCTIRAMFHTSQVIRRRPIVGQRPCFHHRFNRRSRRQASSNRRRLTLNMGPFQGRFMARPSISLLLAHKVILLNFRPVAPHFGADSRHIRKRRLIFCCVGVHLGMHRQSQPTGWCNISGCLCLQLSVFLDSARGLSLCTLVVYPCLYCI